MAILRTDRDEQTQLSCYEAMLRLQSGLNAHHKKPPTIDFGTDAVVLRASSPIRLDCRGVTWSAEHRESEHEVARRHYAAIALPTPGGACGSAAAALAKRFGAELVEGPVPIPSKGGSLHTGLFVRLSAPPEKPATVRAQLFRADLVKQLQKLERECGAIEQKNRQLVGAVEAAQRAMGAAERALAEDASTNNVEAFEAAESKWRVAKVVQRGKTLPVPAEKRSSIERLRATLRHLDGSKLCFLTGMDAGGIPDGGTLENLDELAARLGRAPGSGWHWRSRRPGPLGGDASPRNPAGRAPAPSSGDTGHSAFSYDVAGVDDQRDLFGVLHGRSIAYRIEGGWRVIVELSRPCTDDELPAVVAALDLGTESYSTWGWFPPPGTSMLNLDNVPPVDVDQALANVNPNQSGTA